MRSFYWFYFLCLLFKMRGFDNLFDGTASRRGQDSPRKSQSEWHRTGINGESTSIVWPTLGSRTAKDQIRSDQIRLDQISNNQKHCYAHFWIINYTYLQYLSTARNEIAAHLGILGCILVLQKQRSNIDLLCPVLNTSQPLSLYERIQPQRVSNAVQHMMHHHRC